MAGANALKIDDDPLSSVIHDLAQLSTDAGTTIDESQLPSDSKLVNNTHNPTCHKAPNSQKLSQEKHVGTYNDEEYLEDRVGTPDSLENCKINNKPVPPPRTRLPPPLTTSSNSTAGTSEFLNGNGHKQPRSESDHELLMSLTGSGKNYVFYVLNH